MDRKRERILWISITSLLLLTLIVILLSPVASAQTTRRKNTQEYIRELEAALYILQTNYVDEVDPEILFKGAISGLFDNLDDPYSLYLDDEFLEQMTDTTEGKYGGVGLYISRDRFDEDNPYGRLPYVKVVSPIETHPAGAPESMPAITFMPLKENPPKALPHKTSPTDFEAAPAVMSRLRSSGTEVSHSTLFSPDRK